MREQVHIDEAADLITPIARTLASCSIGAWQDWDEVRKGAPEQFLALTPRTRASAIHDFTIRRATRAFPSDGDGPRMVELKGRLWMLNVNDRLSLRFKRLRSGLTTSNILTGQQVQLQLQLPIDGLEAPTNAVVGYVPNETSSGVSRLAVVCRHAGRLLWVLDLPTAEDGAQPAKLPDGVGPRAPRIGPGEGAIEINTRDQRLTGS